MDTAKLRSAFPETTVFKSPSTNALFKAANTPSFLRDWILHRKADASGHIADPDALNGYVRSIIPGREDSLVIRGEALDGQTRKFLAKVDIDLKSGSGCHTFAIDILGITHSQTIIEDYVWERIRSSVERTAGGWGLVRLGYQPPSGPGKRDGRFTLLDFKSFRPYTIDLGAFVEARRAFTVEEWLDVLLGAIDYNPDGYASILQKHTMLTRLLPFVEPRLNLVELAPKGTGKSYLFGQVGKYGWLVSGGKLTRAKMFYDMNYKRFGLVADNDFVALDEIQSIDFTEPGEMQGALKAYMESGEATVGQIRVTGDAGILLLGNIDIESQRADVDRFRNLPAIFHESALLDRFHGFIRGIDIPRMTPAYYANGWALNTEYFCEIMHRLRGESLTYRGVVEALVDYPKTADTRDTEAVLRIATAYLRLLFPHVRDPKDIAPEDFRRWCLEPAVAMRAIIRRQLQLIDPKEFGGKDMANYAIR